MSFRIKALSIAVTALCAFAGAPALAADYPQRPVTIIVPYAPGGMGDVFARVLGERLTIALKQPFIVENKPGGGGTVGTRMVVKAPPDGYTLLLGQTGEISINQIAMKNPGYDSLKDLMPVILVGDSPLVMVTAPSTSYKTVQDLRAAMIAKPGELNYASSGTGTPGHLAAAAYGIAIKAPGTHVPYKGGGPAMTDVLGGHVAFFFASAAAGMPQIQGGKAIPLAVSTPTRMPTLPKVPTIAESGVPGFSFSIWGGVFTPAKTPVEIVTLLNREINKIIADPATRTQLEQQGAVVKANKPEEFAEFVRKETVKYDQIIKQTGVVVE